MTLPADGQDRITQEIQGQLISLMGGVRPLSRDFGRGINFGSNIQIDSLGQGGLLETIIARMRPDAEPESDLFYLGAVLGSIAAREVQR